MAGEQVDCLHEVGEDLLGDEVVEVDSHPARLDPLAAPADLVLVRVGLVEVDAEKVDGTVTTLRVGGSAVAVAGAGE